MSKPLILNESERERILDGIKQKLSKMKNTEGAFNLKFEADEYEDKATITFTEIAELKMQLLVQTFDSEVAWHGTVTRDENNFTIEDIFVYPQEVSGATVTTDQDQYTDWLYALDDTQFNRLRFQGHSHVNMSTFRSSTDAQHQEEIVNQLGQDDYYIFMICNKKGDINIWLYDMVTNRVYTNKDITLERWFFIEESKEMVKTKSYTGTKYKSQSSKSSSTDTEYSSGSFDWSKYFG